MGTICARYLRSKLQDSASVFQFYADGKDRKEVFHELMLLMNDAALLKCANCLQDPCEDGLEVQERQLRVGLEVTGPFILQGSVSSVGVPVVEVETINGLE